MPLFAHQAAGLEFADRPRAGFFADCGTGKTVLTLAICQARPRITLILAPLQVMRDAWQSDAARFFPELDIHVHHGPRRWKTFLGRGDCPLVLTTHETFRLDHRRLLAELDPERLVVDESSKVKNRKSKVAIAAIEIADAVDEVYILTGTPATEGDDSAYWSQLRLLDPRPGGLADSPGRSVGKPDFFHWANYYCSPEQQMIFNARTKRREMKVVAWRLRDDRREEFERRLSSQVMRIDKSECLDLPPRTVLPIRLNLDPAGTRAYAELLNGVLPGTRPEIVEANALGRKLHQVCGGVLSDGVGWQHHGRAKLAAMAEKVEELQALPFLVWAQYREEADRVSAELTRLKIRHGLCNGRVGPTRTAKNVVAFKAGELQALVCHPQSVGHGVTLTRCGDQPCSTAIYYSVGYSWELHHQSMERIHRAGQTMPCTYYQLVARDTIDEAILEAHGQKKDASDAVLNSLLARQKRERGIHVGGAS